MPLLGLRGYARHRAELGLSGTTHRAVQKAISGGRIFADADGKIDSDAADRAWADNSSEGHRRGAEYLDRVSAAPVDSPPPVATARVAPPAGPTLAQASAFEKGWKGKLAKLQYEEREGKLVRVEEVRERWAKIVLVARNKFLGLPNKAKDKIPELSATGVRVLEDLVREYLEDLDSGED